MTFDTGCFFLIAIQRKTEPRIDPLGFSLNCEEPLSRLFLFAWGRCGSHQRGERQHMGMETLRVLLNIEALNDVTKPIR